MEGLEQAVANQVETEPDFNSYVSKGLSGGTLPISLTTCSQSIYDAFLVEDLQKAFLHGHSFTGNPIGCVAAIASIELLEKTMSNKTDNSFQKPLLCKKINSIEIIKEIRQTGTILAVVFPKQKLEDIQVQ